MDSEETGLVVCNPLIIAIVLVIGVLLLFHIPYGGLTMRAEALSICSLLRPPAVWRFLSIQRVELLKKLASHSGGLYCGSLHLHGECFPAVQAVRPG